MDVKNNITIISDNCYAKNAVIHILGGYVKNIDEKERFSIFLLEKNTITDDELLEIIKCGEGKLIVFCQENMAKFLSVLELKKEVIFIRYDISVKQIQRSLEIFLGSSINKKSHYFDGRIKNNPLSQKEKMAISLCAKGVSVTRIAELMCVNQKTAYAHKRSAMKKMGSTSNIDFLRTAFKLQLV